tara:strand:+ start:83 stop:304 length:222 start_codon:yes stop_codon:yes gene_type:complete
MALSKVSINDYNAVDKHSKIIRLGGGMAAVYEFIDQEVSNTLTDSYQSLIDLNETGNEDLQELIHIKVKGFNY